METKANLVRQAKAIADKKFDKQMLDHLIVIKSESKFHNQHRTMLLEYVYAHRDEG